MEIMPELYYEIKSELDLINHYMDKVINRYGKRLQFSIDDKLLDLGCLDIISEKIRNLHLRDLTSNDKVYLKNLSVIVDRCKNKFSNYNNDDFFNSYKSYVRGSTERHKFY